jgi:hypothetical protein
MRDILMISQCHGALSFWQAVSGFKSHDFYGVLFSYQRFGWGCDLKKISRPPPDVENHLIYPWLLGEKGKLIIIRNADDVIRARPWHDIPTVVTTTKDQD